MLHEAASGVFLRVWEEASTIFIDYVSNSELIPFMQMITTFARKEHQSDVGNLSNVHF